MKIGLLADLHMNLFRRFNPFFIHVENAVDVFCDECKKRKIETIIIPGDLFHTKYQLSTAALIKANNIIDRFVGIANKVVIIRGNHDSASNVELDINLCENYKSHPKVIVVNDYYPDVLLYGFQKNSVALHYLAYFDGKEAEEKIAAIQTQDYKKNYLFAHLAVTGFKMNANYEDKDAPITSSVLEKFDGVFLGHFHNYQNKNSIYYISSPLESKHGDEFGKHGFMFLDTDSNKAEFVENKTSPRFITLDMNKENVRNALTLKNHYIRFIVQKHVSRDLLLTVRQKLLVNNFDVEYKFNIKDDILQFTSLSNWEDVSHNSIDELFTKFLQQTKTPTDTTKEELLEAILN